jgi:hypothetical protein
MVTTTNQYSSLEGVDAITGGRFGILKVELLWGSLQQAAIGQQTSNKVRAQRPNGIERGDGIEARQHNVHMKKYKRTNNDLQNIHIKLKIK